MTMTKMMVTFINNTYNQRRHQVFRRQQGVDEDSSPLSEEAMDKSRAELAELERSFLERVAETTSKLKQGGGRGGGISGGGASG